MRSVKHDRWCRWITGTRKALGLTQAEAAERIGVSIDTLQSWEQGTRYPTPALRVRLCIGLRLDPLDEHWLVKW